MKELKDSMDTIRLTAADFLEKLETAVAERSAERMTAMQYAEKLIANREQEITIFDDEQRNLIVNFAFKLDDRAATEELVNGLAAALAEDDKEEANRLMYEAQEKIENLPDRMIGLSEIFISRPVTMASTIPYIIRTSRNGMAAFSKRMEISLCRML